ncbi:hypothetical protein [Tepidanaerobacter syntrophicus]|uniref:hypothetical protein n=1 Tax=Tepidanaerobacter syntrophicus TaxID=224999 RepID=UPI001BD2E89A|nr:hypothetical protein [Tepidanaerobacter syntrophicus]
MAEGISKLAQVIADRIAAQTERHDELELGTIQDDMSLKLDKFNIPIPKSEYLICRSLTLKNPMTKTVEGQGTHPHGPSGEHTQEGGSGAHTHPETEGAHVHDVICPPELKALKAGDRVLVAWVNGGVDPVIIDVVVNIDA